MDFRVARSPDVVRPDIDIARAAKNVRFRFGDGGPLFSVKARPRLFSAPAVLEFSECSARSSSRPRAAESTCVFIEIIGRSRLVLSPLFASLSPTKVGDLL